MRELSTDGANKCVLARDDDDEDGGGGGEDETDAGQDIGRKGGRKRGKKKGRPPRRRRRHYLSAKTRVHADCPKASDHVFAVWSAYLLAPFPQSRD